MKFKEGDLITSSYSRHIRKFMHYTNSFCMIVEDLIYGGTMVLPTDGSKLATEKEIADFIAKRIRYG
jgi:hypothetical protein